MKPVRQFLQQKNVQFLLSTNGTLVCQGGTLNDFIAYTIDSVSIVDTHPKTDLSIVNTNQVRSTWITWQTHTVINNLLNNKGINKLGNRLVGSVQVVNCNLNYWLLFSSLYVNYKSRWETADGRRKTHNLNNGPSNPKQIQLSSIPQCHIRIKPLYSFFTPPVL